MSYLTGEIAACAVVIVMIFLTFLFFQRKVAIVMKRLDALEKEAKKIEDTQINNTVSLADIHGIVSSIDEKQPFHIPHQNN